MTIPTMPTEPQPVNDQFPPEILTNGVTPDISAVDNAISKGGLMGWIRRHKRTSAGILASVTAATAGTVLAVNTLRGPSDVATTPIGTPTSETTPSSTETPTQPPVEIASPFVGELATTPDIITTDAGLPIEQFKELLPSERTAYFINLARDPTTGLAAYAKMYEYISGNSADALPTTISINNTPSEIITIATYGTRFALSLEPAIAEKAAAGTMYNSTSNAAILNGKIVKEYAPISARVLGADSAEGHGLLTGTVISAGEKMKDTSGTTYINIILQAKGPNGLYKINVSYYYVTNGSLGMWEIGESAIIQ